MTDTPNFDFPKATITEQNLNELDKLPVHWVQTEHELYQLIDEIDGVDVVALDTEFIKRTTYYPILALAQVNTGKAIYLVDAPKLDLTEFWEALIEVPTMVWYACGEDLGIFYLLAKCPALTNVFDVQIGVAYLTGKMQAGYSQAVSEILGIEVDKGESQSNWLTRPLTSHQERYAANDVRYLLALYQAVQDELIKRQVLDCAIEDSHHYARELHQIQNQADDTLYLDLLAPIYNRRQIGVLQQLTQWREALARATNEPKTFVIGKQALREIVLEMPDNIKQLARTTINRAALRRYGEEIVRIIRQVKATSEDNLPPLPPPTYHSKDKPFKNPLNDIIQAYELKHHIPANLLLKNRWVNELLVVAAYDGDIETLSPELLGYRKALVVDEILPLLKEYKAHILQVFAQPVYEP
ncbi:ribonuclease D [Moraxella pluranimalium]|uniref:Ribonuclease D n=1 Tax=Moraxella pluranimalium TaxID=470453 RepID=A0A1T0CUH8_9GAMM|nr:HRDC domain-containing protein [Moraxella pluranimalium]OOS25987.1 ribonuclease D [Moraxella pluranimalium]